MTINCICASYTKQCKNLRREALVYDSKILRNESTLDSRVPLSLPSGVPVYAFGLIAKGSIVGCMLSMNGLRRIPFDQQLRKTLSTFSRSLSRPT